MDEYKDYFIHGNKKMNIKGCIKNGIPEKKADELWDIMAMAANYALTKFLSAIEKDFSMKKRRELQEKLGIQLIPNTESDLCMAKEKSGDIGKKSVEESIRSQATVTAK